MSLVFTSIALTTLGALVFKDTLEKSEKIDVISSVNNKTYAVVRTGDYVAAANMLASLEDKARNFIAAASAKYPNDLTIKRIQKYWTGTISEIPQSETIAYALEKRISSCASETTPATSRNWTTCSSFFFTNCRTS